MVGAGYLWSNALEKKLVDSPAPEKRRHRGTRDEFFGRNADRSERIKALVEKLKSKTK